MTTLHLDTHVVVWIAGGTIDRLPAHVRRRLAESRLRVSPMVRLELELLHEIGRITAPASLVLETLGQSVALEVDETPFEHVARVAATMTWTRDPFDRVIAAQAIAAGAVVATKDARMRAALGDSAIWD